jgi:hypothetical protein
MKQSFNAAFSPLGRADKVMDVLLLHPLGPDLHLRRSAPPSSASPPNSPTTSARQLVTRPARSPPWPEGATVHRNSARRMAAELAGRVRRAVRRSTDQTSESARAAERPMVPQGRLADGDRDFVRSTRLRSQGHRRVHRRWQTPSGSRLFLGQGGMPRWGIQS